MAERDELVTQMTQEGTWRPMFGPMLGEVAEALRMAGKLREAAEEELFVKSARSGRSYIHPGVAAADIEVRRAALLLQRVADMAAKVEPAEPEWESPLRELDAEISMRQLDAMTQLSDDPVEDARIHREMDARQRAALSKGRRK
jgi:hypothetical protein